MTPCTAAILAGGRSERMGQDKAQIVWEGETLLMRTARVAQESGASVLVVGRSRPEDWPWPDMPFFADRIAGQGPLAGLQTALQEANSPVIALACDMPRLTAQALRWLAAQDRGRDGAAVWNEEQPEPLFSVYTPAVLPLIEQHLQAGRRSLQGILAAGDFSMLQAPPEIAAALVNVNTPDDLTRFAAQGSQRQARSDGA